MLPDTLHAAMLMLRAAAADAPLLRLFLRALPLMLIIIDSHAAIFMLCFMLSCR